MDFAFAFAASTVAFMASLRRALARALCSFLLSDLSSSSGIFFSSGGSGLLRLACAASGCVNTPTAVAAVDATAKNLHRKSGQSLDNRHNKQLRKANALENSFGSTDLTSASLTCGRHGQAQSSSPSYLADIPPRLWVCWSVQRGLKRWYLGRRMRKQTCPVA